MRFAGKSAMIAGAARGIGKVFAAVYVADGATFSIVDDKNLTGPRKLQWPSARVPMPSSPRPSTSTAGSG
jgi:hypothetical protein